METGLGWQVAIPEHKYRSPQCQWAITYDQDTTVVNRYRKGCTIDV